MERDGRTAGLDSGSLVEPLPTVSGSFVISGGAAVVPAGISEDAFRAPRAPRSPGGANRTLDASIVPLDQVIPDDLIVQGSLCVGFDCVNNESFGFDTIRLKENNLRIKFQDTSVGSFPTNDWQLIANDSASGGSSKFSIEDTTGNKVPFTVTAGAATNSIFVDSTGRVGFRTSTPVLDLHTNTSNTPAFRMEQNNSGGFTAQTWDVAGNEANFFVRDVTGGSRLPLRIRPGAPTSSLDISSTGKVGIGTASPQTELHVNALNNVTDAFVGVGPAPNTGPALNIGYGGGSFGEGASFFNARPSAGATGINPSLRFLTANTQRLVITKDGFVGIGTTSPTHLIQLSGGAFSDGVVWSDASSRDLKDDIRDLTDEEAFGALQELNPVSFVYKAQADDRYLGFIAEDVPELVALRDRKGVAPMDLVALLTKVVQAQNKTIGKLTERINSLEAAQQR